MAKHNYDETGNMVSYFVFTFLSVFLVPYSLASFSSTSTHIYLFNPETSAHSMLQSPPHSPAANASIALLSANVYASESAVLSFRQS